MTTEAENRSANFIALLTVSLIAASLYIFSPFLMYILVASTLALCTSHGYTAAVSLMEKSRLPRWLKGPRKIIVSALFTSFFLLYIFLPLLYFVTMTIDQVSKLSVDKIKATVLAIWNKLMNTIETIEPLKDIFNQLQAEGTSLINGDSIEAVIKGGESMVSGVSSMVVQIAWILTFYFLFNLYGSKILHFLATLMPTNPKHERYLYRECTGTVAVVFYGTLFNMVAQGIAFGILMVFIGGYDSLYLGVLAGFCSVIPIIGAALVYIPVIALEVLAKNYVHAVVILIFAWAVMGFFIDNILRMFFITFLKKLFGFQYTMNEILILLSILAGIATLGFWGLIIGPSVIALTIAAANLYRDYLNEDEHNPTTGC